MTFLVTIFWKLVPVSLVIDVTNVSPSEKIPLATVLREIAPLLVARAHTPPSLSLSLFLPELKQRQKSLSDFGGGV